MQVKKQTVRMRHGTTDWFQVGKGVHQSYIVSLCLFNLYAEYIMQKVKEESEKAGLKLNTKKMRLMASTPITSWHLISAMKLKDACSLEEKL